MPNIKKHRYASILLSRFFNMRLSNRALISKPLDVYIESTCSHQHPPTNKQPTLKHIQRTPVCDSDVQNYSAIKGYWNTHIPLTSKTTTITTFTWLRFKLHHQRRDVFCATFLFPVRAMGINQYLSRRASYVSDACKHFLI